MERQKSVTAEQIKAAGQYWASIANIGKGQLLLYILIGITLELLLLWPAFDREVVIFVVYGGVIALSFAAFSLYGLAIGIECTRLGANVADDQYTWFKFAAAFNIGFGMAYVFFAIMVAYSPYLDVLVILTTVPIVLSSMVTIRLIYSVTSYPVQMANVLERWQQAEGGPQASFMKPLLPWNLFVVADRLSRYYEHEANRQNKQGSSS